MGQPSLPGPPPSGPMARPSQEEERRPCHPPAPRPPPRLSLYVPAIYNGLRMGRLENLVEECEGLQWDAGNSAKIWTRHQVTPAECEEIFFNLPLIVAEDEVHSADEVRMYSLGRSDAGRFLFIVFTISGRLIRVISARDMSRKERKVYLSS